MKLDLERWRMPHQNLNATFVASTFQGIQASESKLRISAASNLQSGFVASTSTKSKLRNPSFEFRPHQTSKPASSHPRPRNPSFEIHASNFGDIEPTRRLRRIHVHGIQASNFDLCCNRCDRRTVAFLLYTFVGNDGRRAPALTRQKVRARAFSRRARFHLACPLPQSNSLTERSRRWRVGAPALIRHARSHLGARLLSLGVRPLSAHTPAAAPRPPRRLCRRRLAYARRIWSWAPVAGVGAGVARWPATHCLGSRRRQRTRWRRQGR